MPKLKPKFFQLFEKLTPPELKGFLLFLKSPFFNSDTRLADLISILTKKNTTYTQVPLSPIFRKVYPNNTITQAFINKKLSKLTTLLKTFFIQKELKDNKNHLLFPTLETYQKRGLSKAFIEYASQIESTLSDQEVLNETQNLQLWSLYRSIHRYPEVIEYFPQMKQPELLQFLDHHYVLLKLRYAVNIIPKLEQENFDSKLPFFKELMQIIPIHFAEQPIIMLYFQLCEQLLHKEKVNFKELDTAFRSCYLQLEKDEQLQIYTNLFNIGTRKQLAGQTQYIKQSMQLTQFVVKHQLFEQLGHIRTSLFLNICTACALTKSFDWGFKFIETHKNFIESTNSTSIIALSKANLYFHQGQFDHTKNLLEEVKGAKSIYRIRVHTLYVRCLLELYLKHQNNYSTLKAQCVSYARFIRRNSLLKQKPDQKESYLNLLRCIKQIIELRQSDWDNVQKKEALCEDISQLSPLTAKDWLLTTLDRQQPDS